MDHATVYNHIKEVQAQTMERLFPRFATHPEVSMVLEVQAQTLAAVLPSMMRGSDPKEVAMELLKLLVAEKRKESPS